MIKQKKKKTEYFLVRPTKKMSNEYLIIFLKEYDYKLIFLYTYYIILYNINCDVCDA